MAEIVTGQSDVRVIVFEHFLFDGKRQAIEVFSLLSFAARTKDRSQIMHGGSDFTVVGPEVLFNNRQGPTIQALAFFVSPEPVKNGSIGHRIHLSSRIVFTQQPSRDFPCLPAGLLSCKEIVFGVQDASNVGIKLSGLKAVLTVASNYLRQSPFIKVQSLVEAPPVFVKDTEIISGIGCLDRVIPQFSYHDYQRRSQAGFGILVFSLRAPGLANQLERASTNPRRQFSTKLISQTVFDVLCASRP